jgi:hypothetical protein
MFSTYHDQYVCEHCISNNYYYAYVRNGQDYVHADHVVTVGDEHYHVDYLDHYDIYYCEESSEYWHIDDLVMTLRGFIHCDYATSIDHADTDGNDYAHDDDVHELSDGTKCHTDDAERIQAEIDEETEDEDEPQPEPLAPVFEILNNAIDANQHQTPDYVPDGAVIIANGTTYIKGQQQNENN